MERAFKIRSREELMNAPDPEYLVDQILPKRGLAVLVGSPGVGKTFAALGFSLSVCSNKDWLGFETHTGGVIYVTSEGLNGLKLRMQAWEDYHKVEVENFGYVTEAPQFLHKEETEQLIQCIKLSAINKPVLIVIDTLARHMVGGDENSSLSMGTFIANVDKLRNSFDCAVVIVHHTGKNAKSQFSERGSSSLRGAADTMLLLEVTKNGSFIKCEKQKDSEPFEKIPLSLIQIELPNGSNSCVLIKADNFTVSNEKLDKEKEKILDVLLDYDQEGLKSKEIIALTRFSPSTYFRYRKFLTENGFIDCGAQQRYFLTVKGREYALTLRTLPKHSHESHNITTITPTPL